MRSLSFSSLIIIRVPLPPESLLQFVTLTRQPKLLDCSIPKRDHQPGQGRVKSTKMNSITPTVTAFVSAVVIEQDKQKQWQQATERKRILHEEVEDGNLFSIDGQVTLFKRKVALWAKLSKTGQAIKFPRLVMWATKENTLRQTLILELADMKHPTLG